MDTTTYVLYNILEKREKNLPSTKRYSYYIDVRDVAKCEYVVVMYNYMAR